MYDVLQYFNIALSSANNSFFCVGLIFLSVTVQHQHFIHKQLANKVIKIIFELADKEAFFVNKDSFYA
jgi:hypothetical protein